MTRLYFCDEEQVGTICFALQTAQYHLNTALNMSEDVYEQIQSGIDWVADSQKVMVAFLDILLQFHKDLSNEESAIVGCIEELKLLRKRGDLLYSDCSELLDIENIK